MRKGLCEISNPKQWKTISTEMLTPSGYPVYGANGIIGYYSAYNHSKETLLITCRGATCGNLNICEPYSYVNGNAMAIDDLSEEIDIKYLYYYLLNRGLSDVITGSAQPQIVRQSLEKVYVEYPEINKQKKLISVLDKVAQLISLRKMQLSKLDELVKSRFIELFGDPVIDSKKHLVKSLQELIDMGYITYHLDGNHGGDYPRSEEFVDSGVPYIGANSIVNGEIDFSMAKFLTVERAGKLRKGIAQNDDVLFAHNATVGPTVVLKTTEPKVILSTSLTAYRCNQSKLLPNYLKVYMQSDGFVRQYSGEMKQTTRNQVPITAQKKYLFLVPPIVEQEQFAAFVEQTDKSKLAIQKSLEKLETLKKALMQKYFG